MALNAIRGALAAVLLATGCGQQDPLNDDPPLVAVGDHVISLTALQRFEEALPEFAKSSAPGAQARRKHLQSLVDRHIMGIEVERRELEATPDVQKELAQKLRDKLIQDVLRDSVDSRVYVTEQELREDYEARDLGWQVIPAHMLLATEADAEEVVRALQAGSDFATLARVRSLADDAERGGNLEQFFNPGDMSASVRLAAFRLQTGEVSAPIQTADGFEVVKILHKRRLPFEELRATLSTQAHRRKRATQVLEFLARLNTRWEVRYHGEQAQAVLNGLQRGGLQAAEEGAALVSYRGGQLQVGTFFESMRQLATTHQPKDSLAVFLTVDRSALRDTLLLLQARVGGRDLGADVLAWVEAKREELVFEHLYKAEVASRVSVDEEEVRRHYEQHLDSHTSLPGPIRMTEVLVDSQEEAQQILDAAHAGESLQALAQRYSKRGQLAPVGGHTLSDSGRMHIESLFQSSYRDVFGDSNREDVGKVLGPRRVQDRYSVFRLDAPIELVAVPYEQIRRPIRHRLRKSKEASRFEGFIDSLRDRHAPQTRWFENNLAQAGVAR